MIRVHATTFCEKLVQTAQNSYVVVNPCAGHTYFNGVLGTGLKFDALVFVGSEKPSTTPVDIQILGTDGSQSGLIEGIPFRSDAPDSYFQIGLNDVVAIINEPGYIVINIREQDGEWMEAGRLSVRVPVTTHSVQASPSPNVVPTLLS